MKTKSSFLLFSLLSLASACGGGGGGGGGGGPGGTTPVPLASIVAVTDDGRIITFEPGSPETIVSDKEIQNLSPGEVIVALDVRPSTGEIIGLSASGMYRLDAATGVATPVGAPFAAPFGPGTIAMQIDPVTEDVRVIVDNDRNFRFDADTGAFEGEDAPVFYVAGDPGASSNPRLAAIAFSDNHAFADRTTLFAIDSVQATVVRVGDVGGAPQSSSSGQLHTVGALSVTTTFRAGLDITPEGGAIVALTPSGTTASVFHTMDLATGVAREVGPIAVTSTVRALAWRGASVPRILGITDQGFLVSFVAGRPGELESARAVTGLGAGEALVAIDQRIFDGRTYVLTDASVLYRLDTATAVATPVGAAALSPLLAGTSFDLEFTPLFGAGRVVGDGDQNLRISPVTGSVASVDQQLAYGPGDAQFGADPGIVAAAYSDNALGANATTLYALDSSFDNLVRIGSLGGLPDLPNGGALTTIGPLGPNFGPRSGLDIDQHGVALAVLDLGIVSQFCKVNLSNGAVLDIGAIDASAGRVIDVAVELPAPATMIGLDDTNHLVSFLANNPRQILLTTPITGLSAGESVLSIDFEPLTRDLFGITDQDRLLRIDVSTGAATALGPNPIVPSPAGSRISIDADPSIRGVRVVSDLGFHIRVSTIDGETLSVDQPIVAPGNPSIVSIAHTQNYVGATAPVLFGIDSTADTLVVRDVASGPGSGLLETVGVLTVDVGSSVGFDIDANGRAFVSHGTTLYRMDLGSGTLTSMGTIGTVGGGALRDLTVQPR